MSPKRVIPTAILVAWVVLIFDLALLRFPSDDPPVNLVPFRSILHDWRAGGRAFVDRVEGLGEFVELEVVLGPGQSEAKGTRIAEDLMARLGVGEDQLVEGAYTDLLTRGS